MVSVSAALKSAAVDAEDPDRVVGAGAGELEPGALLLLLILVFPATPQPTCPTRTRPPAQPLNRQTVALSEEGCMMKEKNKGKTVAEDKSSATGSLTEFKL